MNKKQNYRSCPLCGSIKSKLLLPATSEIPFSPKQVQVTEKFFGLHGDIVECAQCGFAYVGDSAYVKKVIGLYKSMSDDVYRQEERERRRSFLRVINTINYFSRGKKGKLLDVGCCTGRLLVEARLQGWQVYGADPSIWACLIAKKDHNLDIQNSTIESYNAGKIKFDAIIMLDVLEHVENPNKMLTKLRKFLKPDGIFCIVTPDYGSLTAKILGKKWWGIRLAHLSYFKKNDLERLFKFTGFKIIHNNTYIRYFSLYYIFVRLFPLIEKFKLLKLVLKKISLPLIFFDTFDLYLKKAD